MIEWLKDPVGTFKDTLEFGRRIARSYRSDFGPKRKLPVPKPPEPWETVFPRLRRITGPVGTGHIDVILPTEVLPYSVAPLPDLIRPDTVAIALVGGPKGGKTYALNRMYEALKRMRIRRVAIPEPSRLAFPDMNERSARTAYRALWVAQGRLSAESIVRHGGLLEQVPNFHILEDNAFQLLLFSYAQEIHTGRPARLKYVMDILRPYLASYGMLVFLHTHPADSIRRGTKWSPDELFAFREAESWLPNRIADDRLPGEPPLFVIHVNTSVLPKRDVPQFILSSARRILEDLPRSPGLPG